MVGLTTKQKEELNVAILEYLIKCNYTATAEAFQEETKVALPVDFSQQSSLKKDLLEKKWTSVVRLKKQVLELEKQVKQLKEDAAAERFDGTALAGVFGGKQIGDGLPREPAKFTMQGHRSKITKLVVHPFYNLVASASEDASIRLWDFEQGELERTLKSHAGVVNFLAFNSAGTVLASCSTDLTIKLWNLETFTVMKTLQGHEHEVSSVAFLPSSDYLLSCSRDQSIRFWDTQSGYCLQTLTHGHSDWIRRITVHHNGKLFASASKDESIVVWNCDQVRERSTVGRSQSFADSSDYAVVQVFSDHEHVIDCIAWAPTEACRTIDNANYTDGGAAEEGEEVNGEAEESKEGESTATGGEDAKEDETRASANQRLTTKERIQQMKQILKNKREHRRNQDGADAQEEEAEETKEVRAAAA